MIMKWKEKKQFRDVISFPIIIIILIFCTFLFFLISLVVGRYSINLNKLIYAIITSDTSFKGYHVIKFIRLRRTLAALIIGIALSLSGTVYQNVFNNKLVSPDILGVTSGSCVGAAIAILCGGSGLIIEVSAFFLGLLSVFIALLVPKLINSVSNLSLVLSGVIVGSFMNSGIGFLKYVADGNNKLSTITFWMMGSIVDITYNDIIVVLPIILFLTIFLFLSAWRLNVISFGLEFSETLGINYILNRNIFICCATMLTALAVSISGSIGWIGLVVPHIARALVGNDNRKVLPTSVFIGGSFMIVVDLLARTISVNEIPLSIITGILGTTIYIVILKITSKGKRFYD